MNTAGTTAAAPAGHALAKAMEVRQYVVRHRCGRPVGLYPDRVAAETAKNRVPSPALHGLRVAVAAKADIVAALQQQHCPHIRRR